MSENRNITPDAMILDPSGYVVLEFEDHDDRAHWIERCVPPGGIKLRSNLGILSKRTNLRSSKATLSSTLQGTEKKERCT